MNVLKSDFKVGSRVMVYNPYGSYEYEAEVTDITPAGKYIKVGNTKYKPVTKTQAELITRWGIQTIELIK